MIESVEELRADLQTALLLWPGQRDVLGKREINVRLARAVDDTRSTIPESRAFPIRAYDWRRRET